MEPNFDYLITGGGCAGLSMALQLKQAFGDEIRILVVDRVQKDQNDRSWAFWSREDLPLGLSKIVEKSWQHLEFKADGWDKAVPIAPYTYYFIRGIDYYRYMNEQLALCKNVFFLQAEVGAVAEDGAGPYAVVDGKRYYARWVFDSRPKVDIQHLQQAGSYFMWQHFRGWRVRTEVPCFTPECPTLMDFSRNQDGHPTFFYVLPYSATEALVEYTVFSTTLLPLQAYEDQLTDYLAALPGSPAYTIEEKEYGKIPMTNANLADNRWPHVRSIGTAGNAAKPTTGYAFLNIHRQVATMVEALAKDNWIPEVKKATGRLAWYDDLLLHILSHQPAQGAAIFTALFKNQPFDRILRFLQEDTHLGEEFLIFKSLPISYFLAAAFRHPYKKQGALAWPAPLSTLP
ncbi:MAG: hypothetical protein DA408_06955 [Bacteroidetes bacterium]|nr:MAG: hypothetical protein C7N36_05715 [Bacteroidota bacterium]PTM13444.1 MAG: hypothetical protein DA408_06955 [Bacteroidota bacterium]